MSPKSPAQLPADVPRIQVGMQFRVCAGGFYWLHEGQEIRIPVGTTGEVVAWPQGCAARFEGIKHPEHSVFPMTTATPGQSEVCRWMEVTGMRKERR
jgi:hypothetical protein